MRAAQSRQAHQTGAKGQGRMMHWWFPQLLVALLTIVGCISRTEGSASGTVWAAVNLSDCNATCVRDGDRNSGGAASTELGIQLVNFACYAANAASLRRLSGTKFYLATSTAGQLPESSCAGLQSPAPAYVHCRRRAPAGGDCLTPHHSWQLDATVAAEFLTCQTVPEAGVECGKQGRVQLSLGCRRGRRPAASFEDANEGFCLADGLPRPEPLSVPCRVTSGCRPVWKAGSWGACSRDCGLGEMARSVECSQLTDGFDGPVYSPAPGKCADTEVRPHGKEFCVVRPECPPYYRIRPGKCLPAFSTRGVSATGSRRWCNETGLRPTHAECAQLVGDAAAVLNQTLRRPSAVCRDLPRPSPFQRCRVDAETLKQKGIACLEPGNVDHLAPPRLLPDPAGSQLVQMERLPTLDARCGQEVTMIPGTRLRLHCDVANFKADELRWQKLGRRERAFQTELDRKAKGKDCGRICISHGDLVFARFKPRDAGTYEVTAGKVKARVQLRWHTAYEAYLRAYLPRAHLLRRSVGSASTAAGAPRTGGGAGELVRDAPGRGTADNTLSWMVGPWSDCPCGAGVNGGPSQRKRAIRCERMLSGVYAVVDQGLCLRQVGPAPATEKDCGTGADARGSSCPTWQVGQWGRECPISRCYLRGTSLQVRNVSCRVAGRNETLPDSDCLATSRVSKPDAARECSNAACEAEWSVGPWSPCSASCGAFGFRSRQVQCVWRGTGRPAGLACEQLPVGIPKGYKSCYEGVCYQLGCVDLLPACKIYQASALCAHVSLRKSCCHTCNAYDLKVYQGLLKRRV